MQNLQSTGQPTWLEMQMVSRRPSGMRTVSTVRPSSRPQQVAARAVGGFIAPRDFGQPHGMPLGKGLAQTGRKRGDPRQAGRLPAVDGLVELPGAVLGLAGAQSLAQIGKVHAHERLRHSIIMLQGKRVVQFLPT